MKATFVEIPGIVVLEPKVFSDDRGSFFESYNRKTLAEVGVTTEFVQDNQATSRHGVLRGLHYQVECAQAKLIRVLDGEIFDVAVDLRRSSPTFGKWFGITISGENKLQLYLPADFAHGYLVLSQTAEVLYKASDFWAPQFERCIRWNDPDLAISWPFSGEPVVSEKDARGTEFCRADLPVQTESMVR